MKSPEEFLREFMKSIVHNPMERARILHEGIVELEERESEIRATAKGEPHATEPTPAQ